MPFTVEQFFEVFARYNLALWPWQILALAGGLVAVALLLVRSTTASAGVLGILSAMWLVNGVGYHWTFFAEVNPVARFFAAVFVVEGLLLLAAALTARDLRFVMRGTCRPSLDWR